MAESDLNYLNSLHNILSQDMAWKYILSYMIAVVIILFWNDALNMSTLTEFNKRFNSLVDELSVYFEPCGFPIEIVARFSEGPVGQAMRSVRSLVGCKMTSHSTNSTADTVRSAQTSTNGHIYRQTLIDCHYNKTRLTDVPRNQRVRYKIPERI